MSTCVNTLHADADKWRCPHIPHSTASLVDARRYPHLPRRSSRVRDKHNIKFLCVLMNKMCFTKESRVNLREQCLWKARSSRCQVLRCKTHSARACPATHSHAPAPRKARPLHSLQMRRCRLCSHMLPPPHSLQRALRRLCTQIPPRLPPHSVQLYLSLAWHAHGQSGDFARGVLSGRGHGRHRARRPAHRL